MYLRTCAKKVQIIGVVKSDDLIYTNTNVCCYTDLQIFSDDSITLQYDRRTSPTD